MDTNLPVSTQQSNPQNEPSGDPFALLPTETEIYILPGGEIIVADLPIELAARLEQLRSTTAPALLDTSHIDIAPIDAPHDEAD
jgi:hypothetical protein